MTYKFGYTVPNKQKLSPRTVGFTFEYKIGLSFERPYLMAGLNLVLSRNPQIYIESTADLNPSNLRISLKSTHLSEPSTGKPHNERPLA